MNESILDSLGGGSSSVPVPEKDEILIPEQCFVCKNNLICNIVPTLMTISKLGVVISLEKCPFNNPESKKRTSV